MSDRTYRDAGEWQERAGYSRAVRTGNHIAVSGTTASLADGSPVGNGDTYAQTRDAIARGVDAIAQLGGTAADIVRSRVFLIPGASWEEAAEAHREALGAVAPANTMLFVAGLIGDGLLVEVELDALVSTDGDQVR
jgi:enamine deaminase RidA (YjgF/YER057c/UK114 family)